MSPSILSENRSNLTDALDSSLRLAQTRANVLHRTILVSVAQPITLKQTSQRLFAAGNSDYSHRIIWARPIEGFWMVGIGSAHVITMDDSHPFEEARRSHLSLLDSGLIHGPDIRAVGPIIMGGFLYDPGAPRLGGSR